MKATPLLSLVFLSFKMVTLQRWSESKKTINPNLNPTSILDDNTGWGRVRYPPHLNPDLNTPVSQYWMTILTARSA